MTQPPHSTFDPGPDEKLTPVMIYTSHKLIWGQLVSKEVIRVSLWLSTEMVPKYMMVANAQALVFGAGATQTTLKFPIVNIETKQIDAFHMMPPADESPYFDPDEPNRKMEPVTAMIGVFQFDAALRMAEMSDINTFLSVSKGDFLPIFDLTMSSPVLPAIKGVRFPYGLVRQSKSIFSPR